MNGTPSVDESAGPGGVGAISYGQRAAFRGGIAAVTAGVLLHLPMYLGARDMHYRLANMSADAPMIIGMMLIVLGLAATAFGLLKKPVGLGRDRVARVRVARPR